MPRGWELVAHIVDVPKIGDVDTMKRLKLTTYELKAACKADEKLAALESELRRIKKEERYEAVLAAMNGLRRLTRTTRWVHRAGSDTRERACVALT